MFAAEQIADIESHAKVADLLRTLVKRLHAIFQQAQREAAAIVCNGKRQLAARNAKCDCDRLYGKPQGVGCQI